MRKVTKYTEAIKASVLSKALSLNAPSVVELSQEFNIPKDTIYTWISIMKNNPNTIKQQRPHDRTPASKLQAVIDTFGKTEEEQSAYCRAQGIYPHHIELWKQQILSGFCGSTKEKDVVSSAKKNKIENHQLKNEVIQLKRDLNRKNKVLAELSSLLVLKKKADLLWGGSEDD